MFPKCCFSICYHQSLYLWNSRKLWTVSCKLLRVKYVQTNKQNRICKSNDFLQLSFSSSSCTTPSDDTPYLLLLDRAPNLGLLISCWEINKVENCWYKSVRILEVPKLLFQQFLNLSSSQRDMSGPILGDLSNNRVSMSVSSWDSRLE